MAEKVSLPFGYSADKSAIVKFGQGKRTCIVAVIGELPLPALLAQITTELNDAVETAYRRGREDQRFETQSSNGMR